MKKKIFRTTKVCILSKHCLSVIAAHLAFSKISMAYLIQRSVYLTGDLELPVLKIIMNPTILFLGRSASGLRPLALKLAVLSTNLKVTTVSFKRQFDFKRIRAMVLIFFISACRLHSLGMLRSF